RPTTAGESPATAAEWCRRGSSPPLGLQTLDARSAHPDPVVHPVLPALPELHDLGRDQIPTPVGRHGYGVDVGEALGDVGELLGKRLTGGDRVGLMRRPRTQLRPA